MVFLELDVYIFLLFVKLLFLLIYFCSGYKNFSKMEQSKKMYQKFPELCNQLESVLESPADDGERVASDVINANSVITVTSNATVNAMEQSKVSQTYSHSTNSITAEPTLFVQKHQISSLRNFGALLHKNPENNVPSQTAITHCKSSTVVSQAFHQKNVSEPIITNTANMLPQAATSVHPNATSATVQQLQQAVPSVSVCPVQTSQVTQPQQLKNQKLPHNHLKTYQRQTVSLQLQQMRDQYIVKTKPVAKVLPNQQHVQQFLTMRPLLIENVQPISNHNVLPNQHSAQQSVSTVRPLLIDNVQPASSHNVQPLVLMPRNNKPSHNRQTQLSYSSIIKDLGFRYQTKVLPSPATSKSLHPTFIGNMGKESLKMFNEVIAQLSVSETATANHSGEQHDFLLESRAKLKECLEKLRDSPDTQNKWKVFRRAQRCAQNIMEQSSRYIERYENKKSIGGNKNIENRKLRNKDIQNKQVDKEDKRRGEINQVENLKGNSLLDGDAESDLVITGITPAMMPAVRSNPISEPIEIIESDPDSDLEITEISRPVRLPRKGSTLVLQVDKAEGSDELEDNNFAESDEEVEQPTVPKVIETITMEVEQISENPTSDSDKCASSASMPSRVQNIPDESVVSTCSSSESQELFGQVCTGTQNKGMLELLSNSTEMQEILSVAPILDRNVTDKSVLGNISNENTNVSTNICKEKSMECGDIFIADVKPDLDMIEDISDPSIVEHIENNFENCSEPSTDGYSDDAEPECNIGPLPIREKVSLNDKGVCWKSLVISLSECDEMSDVCRPRNGNRGQWKARRSRKFRVQSNSRLIVSPRKDGGYYIDGILARSIPHLARRKLGSSHFRGNHRRSLHFENSSESKDELSKNIINVKFF